MKLKTTVATFLIFAFVTPANSHAAQLVGPAAAWASKIKTHEPGPAGPPVEIVIGPCPALPTVDGCYADPTIYLSFADRFDLEHEIGHVFDQRNLDYLERSELQRFLGFSVSHDWNACGDASDLSTYGDCPKELFADAYANCALGWKPFKFDRNGWPVPSKIESPYGWNPGPIAYKSECGLIHDYATANTAEGD